ncbi:MAG TPA: tellurite resistance/C4-dicarboxylate transporter family protein [Burkholderiales bacterium]|nr:tellurite resistance/C4-dicarboxylate transporter family protein [Burkholderiales bacterium]
MSRRILGWAEHGIATLYPGCFALVMATGTISNAFFIESWPWLAAMLFAVCVLAYPWLCIAMLIRIARFPRALWSDLVDPRLVFAFFTFVAASDVFGIALDLHGWHGAARVLWLIALVLWLVLIYVSFGVLTFLNHAREAAAVIDGAWLIAIVGTESLVLLGARIAPHLGAFGTSAFVLVHMLWGIGLALYGIFITLFAYRIFFFAFEPDDITPVLWVVMGAAAISANAGSTLIVTDTGLPFLAAMRPFIDGVTLILWAWATWWIPLLVLFGIWKHGACRVPVRYSPALWSLVFPLGMYAVASLRLSLAADFAPLVTISQAMMWIALAAWVATAMRLAAASWRSWRTFAAAGARLPS